jgi:hypothetical protein
MATRKNFKVPRTIRVNGMKWQVRVGSNLHLDGEKVMGACDFNNRMIMIEKDATDLEIRQTFLHEYMHALTHASGIHSEDVPGWIEHILITAMENDMLENNRALFKALFS